MPEHRTPSTEHDYDRPPPARRTFLIGAGLAVAGLGAAVAVLLPAHSHRAGDHHHAAAAGPATTAATSTPDPLVSTSRPAASQSPDRTGTSARDAAKALNTWSSTNPAAPGEAGVGGSAATGAGGGINEVLRIPALGRNWAQPVYEGVADQQLRAGIGHFPTTEQPGQIGNFALAGHRSGVATPALRDVDRIRPGAVITVTTAQRVTYTYTVTQVHTVAPTDVDVIAQVPDQPNATPTRAKLTLVTCWPAYGHSKRVVVEADLVSAKGGA